MMKEVVVPGRNGFGEVRTIQGSFLRMSSEAFPTKELDRNGPMDGFVFGQNQLFGG